MNKIIFRLPPFMIRFVLWCYRFGKPYAADRSNSSAIFTPRATWNL
jgi:hypothetical protein